MAIAGILSVAVGPRFFDDEVFAARSFADDARSALRYARTLAIASGCATHFALVSDGYRVARWRGGSDCNDRSGTLAAVRRPDGNAFEAVAPDSVSVGTLEVFFDAIGRPRSAGNGSLLTSSQRVAIGEHRISIEPETGLVQ
jgi:MSHA pilin protein MshC